MGAGEVLAEIFSHGTTPFPPNHLEQATAADIYAAFLDTPTPPPKVEDRWPFAWDLVWRRLWTSNLSPPAW